MATTDGNCLDCGYDLRCNLSGRCPECGRPIDAPPKPVSRLRLTIKWTFATLGLLIAISGEILWHRAYENVGCADALTWNGPKRSVVLGSFDGAIFYYHDAVLHYPDFERNEFKYTPIGWGTSAMDLPLAKRTRRGMDVVYYWSGMGVTAFHYKQSIATFGLKGNRLADEITLFRVPIWWLFFLAMPIIWMSLRWSLGKTR